MLLHRNRLGFTLVETLITIAVLGILMAIAIPTFSRFIPKCRKTSCIGYDPKNYGCDKDAITVMINEFQGIEIELRHSMKCQASWARSTVPCPAVIYTEDAQGQKYGLYAITRDGYQQHYGDMGPIVLPHLHMVGAGLATI